MARTEATYNQQWSTGHQQFTNTFFSSSQQCPARPLLKCDFQYEGEPPLHRSQVWKTTDVPASFSTATVAQLHPWYSVLGKQMLMIGRVLCIMSYQTVSLQYSCTILSMSQFVFQQSSPMTQHIFIICPYSAHDSMSTGHNHTDSIMLGLIPTIWFLIS